jgi:hypothetical protein
VFYTGYPLAEGGEQKVSERIQNLQRATMGKVVFTFVGSFGRSYELDLICIVARHILYMGLDKIHFVLAGDGRGAYYFQ